MTPDEWVLVAPTILTVAGLGFTVHNEGQHIIVYNTDFFGHRHEYHLWPAIGVWRHKPPSGDWGIGTNTDGPRVRERFRGVRGLVRYMQEVLAN
jgi:hypothetical protein